MPPRTPRDPQCTDQQAIECDWCGECVNGRSFWVLTDSGEILCEECVLLHNLKRPSDAN